MQPLWLGFPDESSFANHTKTHTVEKPYQCIHCDKSFSQNIDLSRHLRMYTEDIPYNFCQWEAFLNNIGLIIHLKSYWKNINAAIVTWFVHRIVILNVTWGLTLGRTLFNVCIYCAKSFSFNSTLKNI